MIPSNTNNVGDDSMYKKLFALVTAVSMFVSMSGCSASATMEPASEVISDGILDARGVWQKMCETVDGRIASSFTSTVEMNASMNAVFNTVETGLTAVTEIALSREPFRYCGRTELKANFFGQDLDGQFSVFAQRDAGGMDTYFHLLDAECWYSKHINLIPTDLLCQYEITTCVDKWTPDRLTLAEATRNLGGKEVYVLDSALPADDILKAIATPIGEIALENMSVTGLELQVTHYVDAVTFLPVQIEIQYQGIGAAMGDLFSKYAGRISGGLMSSVDVEVTTYRETLSNLVYEAVNVPCVPAEGVQNSKSISEFDFADILKIFG